MSPRMLDRMLLSCWMCWIPLALIVGSLLCSIGGARAQTTMVASTITMGEHPRDTVAVVGGIVTLRCVVRNKGPHNVYWFRHGAHKYLSRDSRVFNVPDLATFMGRISIEGNANFGEFNLRIANISMEDNDQYSCMYFLGQDFVGMSEPASLTVYVPPNTGGPRCEMRAPADAGPGMKVTMVCTSTDSLPQTRLDWKHRVEILPGTIVQGPRPKALYEVRLTAMDNGASFTCQESSPALIAPRTCQIRPFFKPTNVSVDRDPTVITTGEDVSIRCRAKALPDQVNYTWSVNNLNLTTLNDARVKTVEGGRVLRISNIKAEDNGTLVTCSATNALNLEASDYTFLTINSEQLQTGAIPNSGQAKNNVAVIGGVLGTFALLVFAAIIAIAKRRRMSKEKPSRTRSRTHQARYSDCEYLEDQRFGGVEICNTPRDAIAEHIKGNPDGGNGSNDDGETAARVLLVAGPPRSREPPRTTTISPVLPPISPIPPQLLKKSPRRSPASPPPVAPPKPPVSKRPILPVLPSNEMPPSLPAILPKHRIGNRQVMSPAERFPAGRLPGMPGRFHAKGPLPRPPR